MVIYFMRYHLDKSIKIIHLYYNEIIWKNEKYEGKNTWWLMIIHKVLEKIKRIGIEILDNIKVLMDTDDKLLDDITWKNAVILVTCVIKDGNKFYPQLFLEEALYDE